MAGEVREALKGVEDAPGVAKVRVSGKTCGRLRAAAGLAALVLGVSLVLGSLGQMAGRLASGVDSGSFGSGWWSTDWQETPAFRQEVAQRLRAFLAMATGSDLEWWDTASGDTYIVSREGESFYEWGVTDTSSETAWVEENTATAAPDKHYAADKNLLYQVLGPERELLYSNVQQCSGRCGDQQQSKFAGGVQLPVGLPPWQDPAAEGWRTSGRLRRWIFYRGFPVGRPRL